MWGSILIPGKYVLRYMCFESPFTRMISSLKYKWPPANIPTTLVASYDITPLVALHPWQPQDVKDLTNITTTGSQSWQL